MILIFATIVFLFSLFVLSKDDFVFLRKNVTLQTIFDTAVLTICVGLLFARLVFALSHPSLAYFNPLVFFVIPYFPGLSVSGLLIGGSAVLYMLTMRQKLPLGKMFDVFALSLLPAGSIVFLATATGKFLKKDILYGSVFTLFFIVLFLTTFLLHKISVKFSLHDGTVSLVGLFIFTLFSFLGSFALLSFKTFPSESPYFLVFIFLLFASSLVTFFKRTQRI